VKLIVTIKRERDYDYTMIMQYVLWEAN